MNIEFNHTRHKMWEHGYVYIIPTLRIKWELADKAFNFAKREFGRKVHAAVDIIWLTFKVTINIR